MKLFKRIILKLMSLGLFNCLSDKTFVTWKFRLVLGYSANLKEPKTFNEKINWLKLYDRKPEYKTYVDKYDVRAFIKATVGEEYLIPLIALYSSPEEIEWEKLPNRFVLKCTTGSGGNVICKDKTKLDIKKETQKLEAFCKHNYYYGNREAQYKDIKARIVCEEFISETEITPNDYKVYCFNGKAKLLEFHIDRFGGASHTCDYYDENLNRLSFTWGTTPSNIDLPYKDISAKIIKLSEEISKNMIHARVDWYVVDYHIYFGEITLHNGGGYEKFDSYEDDLQLGSYLTLPIK
ncbi:MAG: ATP-grasp fold amidoligase family protein [Treponema sp.]